MKVEPGVVLKEFQNDEKRGLDSEDRPGYVKVSGGEFSSLDSTSKMMSSAEYKKISSVRKYDER